MAFLALVDAPLSAESMKFRSFGRKWDQNPHVNPDRGGASQSDLRSYPTATLVVDSPIEAGESWPSLRGRVIAEPDPGNLVPIGSPTAVFYPADSLSYTSAPG
jgi:hypothetical protein